MKLKEKPLIDERIPHPYRELLSELKQIHEQLEEIKGLLEVPPAPPAVPPPVVVPGVPPPAVPRVAVTVTALTPENIKDLAQEITTRLVRLPNRVQKIEIDTSDTKSVSLRRKGVLKPAVPLGFEVQEIGGGFTYVIVREGFGKDERTALKGDKWEIEFDDLLIKGSGKAGTAKVWYWWRA